MLPFRHASVAFAVGGALVASGCGLFAYHASAGHVSSRWLRALAGLSVVLLPVAQLEIADDGVNSIWYRLAALFWAALWRPRTRVGAAVAAVVAFAAAASSSLALLFAPLFAARAIVVPRRLCEHAATAGWAAGCLLQVAVILTSHLSRLRSRDPVNAVLFYAHEVLLPALGWHLSWHLRDIAGLAGATSRNPARSVTGWQVGQDGTGRCEMVQRRQGYGFIAVEAGLARLLEPVGLAHQPLTQRSESLDGRSAKSRRYARRDCVLSVGRPPRGSG